MTQEQIEVELRILSRRQKVLMEIEQVLKRIAAGRGWSRTRVTAALVELEQHINAVGRRVQMLLIEAAKDDDL